MERFSVHHPDATFPSDSSACTKRGKLDLSWLASKFQPCSSTTAGDGAVLAAITPYDRISVALSHSSTAFPDHLHARPVLRLPISGPSHPTKKMQEKAVASTHSKTTGLPRKRFYRARAQSNPLSDSQFPVPLCPDQFDYSLHCLQLCLASSDHGCTRKIHFADIGCGFGGLLVSLSTLFPETLMIGMEIRDKVTEYIKERISALRTTHPGQYQNIAVFKEKNHRRRVISPHLLNEYSYTLAFGGVIYTNTDVEELGEWMESCLDEHPMFETVSEEVKVDPVVNLLTSATEEGQKVARNGGQTFQAIYRPVSPTSS